MKPCAWCAEEIQDAAIVCRHCGRNQRTGTPGTVGEYLPPTASTTNVMAILSVVLAAAAFVAIPVIGSVLGVIFGYKARTEIEASGGTQGGAGLATAGIIIGWVGIGLFAVAVLGFCALAASVG